MSPVGADGFLKDGGRLEELPTVEVVPNLSTAALPGLVGELVRAIDPYTEAAPAATLLHFLAGVGNLIGAGPHARVNYDLHPVRLNVVLVGRTSSGRKGTSWSAPRYILRELDPTWATTRIKTGLSSGEGVIFNVRDAMTREEPIKEKGRVVGTETVVVDAGEDDKRLLVIEPEMAAVLRRMGMESNSLSAVLRAAWDSGDLATLTKNSPLRATGAHISVVSHITEEEVRRYFTATEMANGFGNRFLWALTRRSKTLPEGGTVPEKTIRPLIHKLRTVVAHAQTVGEVVRDAEAKALWAMAYEGLSEGEDGLVGAVLGRGEAQCLRLSVAYALLDDSPVVRPEHLKAAFAVWDYCQTSARRIFGTRLGAPLADRILAALRERGLMTRTEISGVLGRNRTAAEIEEALRVLQERGLASRRMVETAGRSAEVWEETPHTKQDETTKEGG